MLKGFTHDPLAVALRKAIAKGDLEITERDFSARPVQDRNQGPKRERKSATTFAREQRDQFRGREKA